MPQPIEPRDAHPRELGREALGDRRDSHRIEPAPQHVGRAIEGDEGGGPAVPEADALIEVAADGREALFAAVADHQGPHEIELLLRERRRVAEDFSELSLEDGRPRDAGEERPDDRGSKEALRGGEVRELDVDAAVAEGDAREAYGEQVMGAAGEELGGDARAVVVGEEVTPLDAERAPDGDGGVGLLVEGVRVALGLVGEAEADVVVDNNAAPGREAREREVKIEPRRGKPVEDEEGLGVVLRPFIEDEDFMAEDADAPAAGLPRREGRGERGIHGFQRRSDGRGRTVSSAFKESSSGAGRGRLDFAAAAAVGAAAV